MTTDKTGGPAFPSPGIGTRDDETQYQRDGMTLWDWYAGHAVAGFTSDIDILASATHCSKQDGITSQSAIALMAAEIADAMIAERKKRGIA